MNDQNGQYQNFKDDLEQSMASTIDHVTELLERQKDVISKLEETMNIRFVERSLFDSLLQQSKETSRAEKQRLESLEKML